MNKLREISHLIANFNIACHLRYAGIGEPHRFIYFVLGITLLLISSSLFLGPGYNMLINIPVISILIFSRLHYLHTPGLKPRVKLGAPMPDFSGKIEMGSTERLDKHSWLALEFMDLVFNMKPGNYLITDESSLEDFVAGSDNRDEEINHLWDTISKIYGIKSEYVKSTYIVDILDLIAVESRH